MVKGAQLVIDQWICPVVVMLLLLLSFCTFFSHLIPICFGLFFLFLFVELLNYIIRLKKALLYLSWVVEKV